MSTQLQDYAYSFPPELIAMAPADQRDESRLLVVNREKQSLQHQTFKNILDYFVAGDVLVLNNSKVFPCRLLTERATGGKQEIFLLRQVDATANTTHLKLGVAPKDKHFSNSEIWEVMLGPNSKVKAGDVFSFAGLRVIIINDPEQTRLAQLEFNGDLFTLLQNIAHVPLPSYIKRPDTDQDTQRYQTVFAKTQGSVAAPTAGLHFTPEILEALQKNGVEILPVTLHVGLGTFLPVKTADITQHKMHTEFYSVEPEVWQKILQAKTDKRRITAVGTTSVRVLESLASITPPLTAGLQQTNIFIRPPYEFQIVNRMITNFHQSESTLLMLVSAFAGREFILSAYAEAIKQRYRLFSYGDAMLIE